MKFHHGLLGCAAIALAGAADAKSATVQSPDGTISITVSGDAATAPTYTITRRGETIVAPSPLGFTFTDDMATANAPVRELRRTSIDRTLPLVATKAAQARDHYNEAVVALGAPADGRAPIEMTIRAYDDGVAFRYRLPGGDRPVEIRAEKTGFYLAADQRCHGLMVGSTTSSHEGEYDRFSPARLRPYHLYDTGVLCRAPGDRTSFLITEADLADYPGMYLHGRGDGGIGFEASLSPLPGQPRVAVKQPAGQAVTSPWRVVLMADRAGDLIPSTTIGNLNPQPVGDFSWVKPGKSAWDWWSGPYFPGSPTAPAEPMNMTALKKLIDFAGRSGLPYMLVDEGWALRSGVGGSAPVDTDITKTQANLDMPALVAYAKARKVDLMLWLQWSQLDARMTEALDQYVRWGIKGIKVDFMDRNDAVMVDYYHRLIGEAARRRLMVDLHGAYMPTGLNRTWPNFVTQEGVMGAEYNKWSRRITATHNVNLAFTRLVQGPMDYTPGGFRNRTPATFQIVNIPPQVQTSRAAALAMYVVYESPLQMVSDSPDAYAGQPAFEFIRDVPTAWDETRFLDGDVDSHVVVARRKGRDWYIGAMNTEQGRTISLPLSFLGAGGYRAQVWQDGATPIDANRTDRRVTASDTLSLTLAGSGGAAIHLMPDK